MESHLLLSLVLMATAQAPPQSPPLFPFVVPFAVAGPSVADMSGLLEKPAGKDGPVRVSDGHLYAGAKRLRLFGVNLCFAANFPSHEDAAGIAARLARFGVNCVRFHHMDMFQAPSGIFAADGRTLDPDRLDQLDFLISELKARGIYSDLNLHVSRTYPGQPTWEGMPSFHKGVDNFVPAMIAAQRQYARDLLTHTNPYTKTRYVDEPAVAIVEINNENALWQDWFGGRLDAMPPAYETALAGRWNAWLRAKYPTDDALRRGWSEGERVPGPRLLENGDFVAGLRAWRLEVHQDAAAQVVVGNDGPAGASSASVTVANPGGEGWHVQFGQSGIPFRAGESYTATFWARSDKPRRIILNASQAHEPWGVLWSGEVEITPDWKRTVVTFRPSRSDDNGRWIFSNLATEIGRIDFTDATLNTGEVIGLGIAESLGTIRPFPRSSVGLRTDGARRDWTRFLLDVESEYWTGMAAYLKDELGVKAPIVGTQMGWSPFVVQSKLDVIDSHAYWHHPVFPRGEWDPVNWHVENEPMTGQANGGTLPGLALSRVAGKPFLCTEYNHSAPNTYASETFPLISGFASAQDWDGIFAFAYSHDADPRAVDHFASFFDIDAHPAKLVTLPAAYAAWVRGDVPAFGRSLVAEPKPEAVIDATMQNGPYVSAGRFGITRADALANRVAITEGGGETRDSGNAAEPPSFSWRNEAPGRGVAVVDSPKSKAFVGTTSLGPFSSDGLTVAPGPNRQDWAAFTLTAIDGPDLHSPGRILVTATGYVQNTAMGWKDAERSTVGRDWGTGPALVEGIPATITLPVSASKVTAWPLDEQGRRRDAMPVGKDGDKASLAIGPEYRTLWYEIEIRP